MCCEHPSVKLVNTRARVDTTLSRGPKKPRSALIEEYVTLKRASANASPPMTTFLPAATGETTMEHREMQKIVATILYSE